MIRELKFWIATILIGWAQSLTPKDATNTQKWFANMPIEK